MGRHGLQREWRQQRLPVASDKPASTTPADARRRFAAHWETREMPILALVVAKGGLKINPADPAKEGPRPRGMASCPVGSPGCVTICCGTSTMAGLAGSLSFVLKRTVVDRTGVAGDFLFGPYGAMHWRGAQDPSSPLPTLPTLL